MNTIIVIKQKTVLFARKLGALIFRRNVIKKKVAIICIVSIDNCSEKIIFVKIPRPSHSAYSSILHFLHLKSLSDRKKDSCVNYLTNLLRNKC